MLLMMPCMGKSWHLEKNVRRILELVAVVLLLHLTSLMKARVNSVGWNCVRHAPVPAVLLAAANACSTRQWKKIHTTSFVFIFQYHAKVPATIQMLIYFQCSSHVYLLLSHLSHLLVFVQCGRWTRGTESHQETRRTVCRKVLTWTGSTRIGRTTMIVVLSWKWMGTQLPQRT